ncbi:sortase [Dysosmobacter sp. HCP28S3_G4]|uniref:sortase n=1 Tax=Dysosmobacter sp. HCP28S3_G4 TaxID=3438938 RepID=UPI003F8AA59C
MKHKGRFLILTGLLLVAAALFLAAYNLYDEARAKRSATEIMASLEADIPGVLSPEPFEITEETNTAALLEEVEIPDYLLNPDMEMPVENIDGIDYIGVLRIPTLELELPIISEWSYQKLKIAPCRYSGSAYQDDLIIAAHNYNSHFGNLKNLREGDTATFTDMDGNVFTYEMVELEILQPTDIEGMESGEWDLTLFTCTIGGSSRVTARFERVENDK